VPKSLGQVKKGLIDTIKLLNFHTVEREFLPDPLPGGLRDRFATLRMSWAQLTCILPGGPPSQDH